MDLTVGIVVPAFRPPRQPLVDYIEAIIDEIEPETIRVELDDPSPATRAQLASVSATVSVAECRRGKGAAVTAGFEALETDVLVFLDADGSTPVASVRDVLSPVLDGRAGLAVGSRRHPAASVSGTQSETRRRLGAGFAWTARRLLPVSLYDYQCGAKALDAAAWRAIRHHMRETGFGWDVELLALADALDIDIAEVPIDWHDADGSTVSTLGTSLELGRAVLSARARARRLAGRSTITHRLDRRQPILEGSVVDE